MENVKSTNRFHELLYKITRTFKQAFQDEGTSFKEFES